MDIRFDSTGDIDFTEGDISFNDGTSQHITDLMAQAKGENKLSPIHGVGARDYLLSEGAGDFLRDSRMQMQKLGLKVSSIKLENSQLLIDASYVNTENR